MRDKLREHQVFVRYVVIGLSGVTIDVLLFFLLYNFLDVEKNLATFISLSVAITNNFFWNRSHNFKVRDNVLGRYLKFYAVGFSGFVLTAAIFKIFVDDLGFDTNLVKLGSLVPVLLLQYSLNKYWTFKIYGEDI